MFSTLEGFLDTSDTAPAGDTDFLLAVAELVRSLLAEREFPSLGRLIRHEADRGFYEALSWTMDLVQEAYEHDESMPPCVCELGRSVPGFGMFEQTLGTAADAVKNEIKKKTDGNGEVQEFFNICVYPTQHENIFLVSSENFDTRDNDYISYSLLFTREGIS